MPGTPDGSHFGYPVSTPAVEGPDPLADDFGAPSPDEATPEASGEAAPPSEPEPQPKVEAQRPWETPDETQGPAPEPQAQPEQTPEQLFAGRYRSVEDLEKGYKEAQGQFTRQQQAISEQERRILALQQQNEQVTQLLEQMAPFFREQLAEQDPDAAARLEVMEQLKPLVDQQVAPIRQQLDAERARNQVVQVVSGFRAAHPDVPAGSPADMEVAQVVQGLDLDYTNPEALEIAYEAWKDQSLRTVLMANPSLVDTDEGMAYARAQARVMFGSQPSGAATPGAATPAQSPPQVPQAFVETGGSGTPASAAPGATSRGDEFDEAFDAWSAEKKSPLFGGLLQGGARR